MKTYTTAIKTIKKVNDQNEVLPNEYVVTENDEIVVTTLDFAYAMQCFINRVRLSI